MLQPQTSQPTRHVFAASECPFGQRCGDRSVDGIPRDSHTCSMSGSVDTLGAENQLLLVRPSDSGHELVIFGAYLRCTRGIFAFEPSQHLP